MERKFVMRFSSAQLDTLRAELQALGPAGERSLKMIGDAAERTGTKTRGFRQNVLEATPAMRALDAAAKDIRSEFDSLAGRVPVVGGALQALGPTGLAAAAGVVAIGAGITQLLRLSQQAIKELGDLKDAADTVALGVEDFQAFRGVALLEGIDAQATQSMLSTLAINSARASEGFGKMHAALQKVNPELAEQLALTTTQAQRLDILARAVQGATSYNDKLNIAVAAFGSEGAQMVRVLDESGASMDTWRQRAQDAGLIVEDSLVEAVDAIGKRMDVLDARMEVAGQRLGIALAPANEAIAETQANFMLGLTEIVDGFKSFEERTSYSLAVTRNRLLERIKTGLVGIEPLDDFKRQIAEIEVILNARIAQAERMRMLQDMVLAPDAFDPLGEASRGFAALDFIVPPDPETDEQKKKREDDERKAEANARIRAGYEREAIQLRGELGDITGLLAEREKELNVIVAANVGLTKEMAQEVMRRYREQLDGTAEAQARWLAVIEGAKSPLQRVYDELALLTHEYTQGKIEADVYRQAHAALTAQLKETADAEASAAAGVSDSVAAWGELPDVIGRTTDRFGEMRRMSLEVEFGMAGIVGILDQQIEGWEDAERVALNVLRNIAIQAIYTAAQMQNANLGSIISAGFGIFMGGWGGGGQGYVDPALGAYPAAGADIAYTTGAYHHTGGIAGISAAPSKLLPSWVFDNAPRNHRGYPLAADERAAILQVGEPVVSKWDANRIMSAVERGGGGGGDMKVNIYNQSGSEVETRERRTGDGGREVDVFIGRKINSHTAGGGGDAAMRSRYALQPALGR